MGRLSNEQNIQKQIDRALNVEEAIEILSKYDPKTPLGVVGHFGEVHLISKYDVCAAKGYLTSDENWRDNYRKSIEIVEIHAPDIGPEPD